MATFALGTAAGDFTASTVKFGYLDSALLFAGLILIPAVGYRFFGMNEVLAFWFAYVLTRPLGASIADWLGKPKHVGGLGLGDGPVSVAFGIVIVVCVAVDDPAVEPVEIDRRLNSVPAAPMRPS